MPGPMLQGGTHIGRMTERFNGNNRFIWLHEAIIALQQHTRVRQVQACKHLLSDGLLDVAQRIAIDVDSRRLARYKDGEASIATTGIGDALGPYLVHPLVGL